MEYSTRLSREYSAAFSGRIAFFRSAFSLILLRKINENADLKDILWRPSRQRTCETAALKFPETPILLFLLRKINENAALKDILWRPSRQRASGRPFTHPHTFTQHHVALTNQAEKKEL